MTLTDVLHFPTLNAALNAASAMFLAAGYVFIKKKNIAAHRASMLAAFGVSVLFLASYLYYHAHAGSTRFLGTGWIRPVYFSILLTHTVLAAAIVPLVATTLTHAWKGRYERHRSWARVAWPMWIYVSVTGVVIYWILYRWPVG